MPVTTNWARNPINRAIGLGLALLLIAVTVGAGQALASGTTGAGERNPEDLTNCFANGIDAIGRGDVDRGRALWEGCLTDDYSFRFTFFPGGPGIECPGPECPIQDFDSRAELRSEFARVEFERQGYLSTQHQMLNVDVTSQRGGNAEVFAYIQANHFLADDTVDIFWGDYTIQAVRHDGRWQVQREEIVATSFLKFQGTPIN